MCKAPPHIPFDLDEYRKQMQEFLADVEGVSLFWAALEFAAIAHTDQWRKSGDAYILHPCSVAKIMVQEMDITSPEVLTAALLHDTVEDVEEVTPEIVEEKFGSNVRAIVEGCTKVTHDSGDRQTLKKKTHRKLFSGAASKLEVLLVKLADRLHNLRTLHAMPKKKQSRIAEETLDIYAPIAGILGLFNMKREMYDLALLYKFPRKGAKVEGEITKLMKAPRGKMVVTKLQEVADAANIECTVTIRTKRIWAYYDRQTKRLQNEIGTPQEVTLLVGSTKECYSLLGLLNKTFPPIPRTIRDFIASPKNTGYRGLHARAFIEEQQFFFKIRTPEMQRQAQRGMLPLWITDEGYDANALSEIIEMFDLIGNDEQISYREIIDARNAKELYVYSPKGELYQFPWGSTVLDYAFKVHTKLGLRCIGANINGQDVPLTCKLQDGDRVRIYSGKEEQRFTSEMMKYCKTARARSRMIANFRKRRSAVTTEIGHSILSEELAHYSLPIEALDDEKIAILRKTFPGQPPSINKEEATKMTKQQQKDAERAAFYCAIGEGKHRLHKVIAKVLEVCGIEAVCLIPATAYNHIQLTTIDPVVVKLSSCCKPNPIEEGNLALLSKTGVSVHRSQCSTLHNQPQERVELLREDIVAVSWDMERTIVRKVQSFQIYRAARSQILHALADAPQELTITSLEENVHSKKKGEHTLLRFQIPNLLALQRVHNYFTDFNMEIEFMLEE